MSQNKKRYMDEIFTSNLDGQTPPLELDDEGLGDAVADTPDEIAQDVLYAGVSESPEDARVSVDAGNEAAVEPQDEAGFRVEDFVLVSEVSNVDVFKRIEEIEKLENRKNLEVEDLADSENLADLDDDEVESTASVGTIVSVELSDEEPILPMIGTYKRPQGGFGAGILDELEFESGAQSECVMSATSNFDADLEVEEAVSDVEASEVEAAKLENAPILAVDPERLDHWGRVLLDLRLPVEDASAKDERVKPRVRKIEYTDLVIEDPDAIPEVEPEAEVVEDSVEAEFSAPAATHAPAPVSPRVSTREMRETREPREEKEEKFASFERPSRRDNKKGGRSSRKDKRRSERDDDVEGEEVASIIGGIVESVVADKTRRALPRGGRRVETLVEDYTPVDEGNILDTQSKKRRSRSSGKATKVESLHYEGDDYEMFDSPVDEMADEFDVRLSVRRDLDELDDEPEVVEEREIPNNARSRRRRRSRQETQAREPRQSVERERDLDETFDPSMRKRVRKHSMPLPEEDTWGEDFDDIHEDGDWDDSPVVEREAERPKRARRARRGEPTREEPSKRGYKRSQLHEDEEDHVFTEVEDQGEADDDEFLDMDFSRRNVPGWQDTINWIVGTNLKARSREPSSMAQNSSRPPKRGRKR
ncbi:MAG: hypothetical protein Q4D38_01890 [Planctomycetia bacterium]|nr:hypothetical protein [Planctomycetia bacterium]